MGRGEGAGWEGGGERGAAGCDCRPHGVKLAEPEDWGPVLLRSNGVGGGGGGVVREGREKRGGMAGVGGGERGEE